MPRIGRLVQKEAANSCAHPDVTSIQTLCVYAHAGDVLLHTVTDAILGALSLPDIGECARQQAVLFVVLRGYD